jgi:MFS family permease
MVGTENPSCDIPAIQSRGAKLFTLDALISGILSIIVVPRLGALSDRYGRVKLLTLTICGLFVDQLLTLYAVTHPLSLHYNWLLPRSFLEKSAVVLRLLA